MAKSWRFLNQPDDAALDVRKLRGFISMFDRTNRRWHITGWHVARLLETSSLFGAHQRHRQLNGSRGVACDQHWPRTTLQTFC